MKFYTPEEYFPDCTGSCKSNYHTITTMTVSRFNEEGKPGQLFKYIYDTSAMGR
jgi:hypothetical protein